ncbi:hypothetical protein NDA01_20065 [Trichocoleus desertorum AS-A10]|uniref:hypothetical protein n=1 Tax=Trichocoleus desertorum TaxID=1481672 RepID=UPI00329714F3
MLQRRNHKQEYSVVIFWSATAGIIGMYVGQFLADRYISTLIPDIYLGVVGYYAQGRWPGLWVGEILGCWLGLETNRYSYPIRTTIYLAVILPLVFAAIAWIWQVVGGSLEWWTIPLFVLSQTILLVAPPFLARYFSNLTSRGG